VLTQKKLMLLKQKKLKAYSYLPISATREASFEPSVPERTISGKAGSRRLSARQPGRQQIEDKGELS
jgi:hypothetical protein